MKEGVYFEEKSRFACLLHPQSSPQDFIAKCPTWLCWDLARPCRCHSPDGLLLGTCLMPPTPHIILRVQERCSSACRPGPPGQRGADERRTLGSPPATAQQDRGAHTVVPSSFKPSLSNEPCSAGWGLICAGASRLWEPLAGVRGFFSATLPCPK